MNDPSPASIRPQICLALARSCLTVLFQLLVIVGGFGRNLFLQHELRRKFSSGAMKIAFTGELG